MNSVAASALSPKITLDRQILYAVQIQTISRYHRTTLQLALDISNKKGTIKVQPFFAKNMVSNSKNKNFKNWILFRTTLEPLKI